MAPTVSTLSEARAAALATMAASALPITVVYAEVASIGPVAVLQDGTVRQAAVTAAGEWVTL